MTQYVLVTKKGNPFVAKMPFPWYDDLMDKFVLGGITFDIIGDDNAAKAKWYDGSYVFPSEIDDDDIDTGKWKKVTWYQILGYIENAFKEDWAIGIDSVVEGVMDEYEIPYDNNEAYNKVEDLVAELWSKNRRAIINRYYKSHSSTDKFFDSID